MGRSSAMRNLTSSPSPRRPTRACRAAQLITSRASSAARVAPERSASRQLLLLFIRRSFIVLLHWFPAIVSFIRHSFIVVTHRFPTVVVLCDVILSCWCIDLYSCCCYRTLCYHMGNSEWAMWQRITGSKARFGCAKMFRSCSEFVVFTKGDTSKPRFRCQLPW